MLEQSIVHPLVFIVFIGVAIQCVSWRMKLPSIILLCLTGLLLGPVFHVIDLQGDMKHYIHPFLKLALAIILFEGGLQLKIHELKEAGLVVKRLITFNSFFTILWGAYLAHLLVGLSWKLSLTFSCILIVTGPTVIIPMLRQARIPKKISSSLKWEGIINDPIGAILTVLFFEFILLSDTSSNPSVHFLQRITLSLGVGTILGFLGAFSIKKIFSRGNLPEHLKVPFVFSLVLVTYYLSDYIQPESGLLTTTLFGIILGNMKLHVIEELEKFKEYLTILFVSVIFIILSASLDADSFLKIWNWKIILYVVLIVAVLRPITVMLSLIGTSTSYKERFFIGWIAPRGIVSAAVTDVFAPQLIQAGYIEAEAIVPLMFSIIFSTVILHGLTINLFSKKLGLSSQDKQGLLIVGATAWARQLARTLLDLKIPVILSDSSWKNLQTAKMEGIPTFYGEVLSDFSEESLNLSSIAVVLATTDNDSYNALVCKHFSSKVGSHNVYQLAIYNASQGEEKNLKLNLRGKTIISYDDFYEDFEKRFYQGWKFHKTKLTETFRYEDYTSSLPAGSKLVLYVKPNGTIAFNTAEENLNPSKGDTIVSYLPPKSDNLE